VLAALQDIAPDAADSADERPAAVAGVVPIAWLERRCIGAATPSGAFCDIAHSDSLAYLRRAMAAQLLRYGLEDLDAGDVRRRAPRALTQELSRYVFEHGRDAGGAALRCAGSGTARASATTSRTGRSSRATRRSTVTPTPSRPTIRTSSRRSPRSA